MKVLGLVSSPRKGGNSELAVKEIFSQLPDDWQKKMIRINELDIGYCKACYGCVQAGVECKHKDDLQFVLKHIFEADKLVIAAPAYMLGGHTAMKVLVDRFLSVVAEYPRLEGKECVIVSPYGFDGWDGLVKEDMIIFARELNLKILDVAIMLATLPADSVQGDNLEQLNRLAKALIESKQNTEPSGESIECPFCTSRALSITPVGKWKCTVCGGNGQLVYQQGKFSLEFDPETEYHFTHASKDAHTAYLDEKKNLFLANRKEIKKIQEKYAEKDYWVKPE